MGLAARYLSTLPVTVVVEVKYNHMLPLWYFCMVKFGTKFRETVIAIRQGLVSLKIHPDRPASPASAHLVREEKKLGRKDWIGHMTNPDTMVFCRVIAEHFTLESLDEIRCPYLSVRGDTYRRPIGGGLLTSAQHASLPDLYQSVFDNMEVPVLIFSDAAAEWFDAA
jgi:hypothetical protein